MPSTIAVAHYCEGAGHATRMLAVARALEAGGADVHLAGGGVGARFLELNGYDAYEPAVVDFIGEYQDGTTGDVLSGSLPDSARRVRDFVGWLREVDPDALVTDDMFAAMAAVRVGVPQYVVKHDAPSVYDDRLERLGARFHCGFQQSAARRFFYPLVWDASDRDPTDATHVPPVALDDPDAEVAALDAVVVPSHYSDLDAVAERLTERGLEVAHVGGPDWEAVPALLPYIRAADVVVCSGYSTIMEAAVAGTPCVVLPATAEQEGVARRLRDVPGFMVASNANAAVAAATSPTEMPDASENGAEVIADRVLADLRERGPPSPVSATRRGVLRGVAAVGTAAVGTAAVSATEAENPYHVRGSRVTNRSLDHEGAVKAIEQVATAFDVSLPPALAALDPDRYLGASVQLEAPSHLWDRADGPGVIHGVQVALEREGTIRQWLLLGVDTAEVRVGTGVLRDGTASLEPQHLRVSVTPGSGPVEAVEAHSGTGFTPAHPAPQHPSGPPASTAGGATWRGAASPVAAVLCACDVPDAGGEWNVAVDFRTVH